MEEERRRGCIDIFYIFSGQRRLRCRAGALRGPRPLRGEYTGFALGLPMVGAKILVCDQREPRPEGDYKSRSDRPPRRGPGRQAMALSLDWLRMRGLAMV
jgi:hypothetical protein